MKRTLGVAFGGACLAALAAAAVAAQQNHSIDPTHIFVPAPVANPVASVVEQVPESGISAELLYVETNDGLYTPIAMMKPAGSGRFPLVLLAHMNGGQGTRWLREWLHYGNYTPEQLLKAGYAVAWMRYRAEVATPYGKPLVERTRQGRQFFDRGPQEYEDAIQIIKYVKTLPYVDPDRVGWLGLSHGGEMLFKVTSEYDGLRCGIANEPAASDYLAMRPKPAGSPEIPETRERVTEAMQAQEKADARGRVDMATAMARINRIKTPIFVQGRTNDDNLPTFRLTYDLSREAGKNVEWKTYEHLEHGFVFPRRNGQGVYAPDAVQRQAIDDALAYFNRCLKG